MEDAQPKGAGDKVSFLAETPLRHRYDTVTTLSLQVSRLESPQRWRVLHTVLRRAAQVGFDGISSGLINFVLSWHMHHQILIYIYFFFFVFFNVNSVFWYWFNIFIGFAWHLDQIFTSTETPECASVKTIIKYVISWLVTLLSDITRYFEPSG